ncbi:MAG: competence protein CoiA [Streptococcaceae bacterium]|jgi:competence protein CoiA|nr:competence protein CoiA [Streptococcaceae bacterium]
MLVAKNQTGKIVNLLEELPETGDFVCPACGGAVVLKNGPVKRAHFAHVALKECHAWAENESAQHLGLKAQLYQWFVASGCHVEVEYYLPELLQTPDLLVDGHLAIEVQCSRLSVARLRERTENYKRHGYTVLWLMGHDLWLKHTLAPLQRELLYFSGNAGFYFWELDLEKEQLRLKSLIHENLRRQVIYVTRAFSFGRGNLLDVLRTPFARRQLMSLESTIDRRFRAFISQQLYHKNPYWMRVQEIYYLQGRNLVTEEFGTVQWAPPGLDLLTHARETAFCQLSQDLSALTNYYDAFLRYYSQNPQRKLYPPSFYGKMDEWSKLTKKNQIP